MLNLIDHVANTASNGKNGFCKQLFIPSEPERTHHVQDEIEAALRNCKYEDGDIFAVRLALEEALVNAIKHGNQLDQKKKVSVSFSVNAQRCEIQIKDEGTGFEPDDVPDPLAAENLERPCGRGLLLMRHYMNDVIIHPPGNALTMIKTREPAKSS